MNCLKSLFLFALTIVSVSAFGGYTPVLHKRPVTSAVATRHGNLEMRTRICDLLGKRANRKARVVTFSHRRIKKVQEVNLHWKRFWSEELNRKVRLRLSAKGIKTVHKYGGIDAAARKFNIDLRKF